MFSPDAEYIDVALDLGNRSVKWSTIHQKYGSHKPLDSARVVHFNVTIIQQVNGSFSLVVMTFFLLLSFSLPTCICDRLNLLESLDVLLVLLFSINCEQFESTSISTFPQILKEF